MTAGMTCPRCDESFWGSDNPVELDAWRCDCTPVQTLPVYPEYAPAAPVPLRDGAGKSAGAPVPTTVDAPADDNDWLDLDREGLMAAAWVLPAIPVALFVAAFVAMWARDIFRT